MLPRWLVRLFMAGVLTAAAGTFLLLLYLIFAVDGLRLLGALTLTAGTGTVAFTVLYGEDRIGRRQR